MNQCSSESHYLYLYTCKIKPQALFCLVLAGFKFITSFAVRQNFRLLGPLYEEIQLMLQERNT